MRTRRIVFVLWLLTRCLPGMSQTRPACRGPEQLERQVRTQPTAQRWAALAGWFGERRKFACAIPAFQAALRLDAGSARLHYYLGLTLKSAGQTGMAVPELQRSIELDPKELQPYLVLGAAFYGLSHKAEAEETWETALRIDPGSSTALDWLAKARISDGQYVAAIDLLSTAPLDEDLTLDLALAYSKAGLFDKAVETLNAALTRSPASLRLRTTVATVYVQSHRYQEADSALRAALQAHPHDAATELLYLRLLVLKGDYATARPLAGQLLAAHSGGFDALYLSGVLEHEAQQFEIATKHLKAAVALNPNHFDARYHLGVALFHTQQLESAREQLEKAIALDSTQAEAHFQLGQVLRALGKMDEAQSQLKQFQDRLHATAQRTLADTKASQAAQSLNNGDVAAALALYREAIEAEPQDPILDYNLALALDRGGDLAAERVALEKAVQLNPTFAAAQNQLGYVAARSGEASVAEEHFRQALAAAPTYAEAANNLGTILGQQGRDSEAEERFQSAVAANPRYSPAWVNLAATLASESRFPEARNAIDTVLKIDPQNADALRLRQLLQDAPGTQTSPPGSSQDHPIVKGNGSSHHAE
jgi:tetratricopeptide (TPR) repeat protein